jgi:hypothetical protein
MTKESSAPAAGQARHIPATRRIVDVNRIGRLLMRELVPAFKAWRNDMARSMGVNPPVGDRSVAPGVPPDVEGVRLAARNVLPDFV